MNADRRRWLTGNNHIFKPSVLSVFIRVYPRFQNGNLQPLMNADKRR